LSGPYNKSTNIYKKTMKMKLYLKSLLTLALVSVFSFGVNAQKSSPQGSKGGMNRVPPNPLPHPHVHSHVKYHHHAGDSISLDIHAPQSVIFTLTIYDTANVAVSTSSVHGGDNALPVLPIGNYTYTLEDTLGTVVSRGNIKVKPPHVHAHVKYTPTANGDSISLVVRAPQTASFTLTIYDTANVAINTLTVNGGANALPVLPIGNYTYTLADSLGVIVSTGKIKVKPPHVRSHVRYNPAAGGDSISLDIHAPQSEVFTLTIYDTANVAVNTLSVHGGNNLLPVLPIGHYTYTLTNAQGLVVSTGNINVRPPRVRSHVKYNHAAGGDSLSLHVHAPQTAVFTMTIYDTANVVVNTLSVNGGDNPLPVLPIGHYTYTLTNAQGLVVSTGNINVRPPHVHSHVKYNPPAGGDSIYLVVDAPQTAIFTLTIYDTANVAVNTSSVNGGDNLLPVLPVGHYTYTLTNALAFTKTNKLKNTILQVPATDKENAAFSIQIVLKSGNPLLFKLK
jgi:hypothetical protein